MRVFTIFLKRKCTMKLPWWIKLSTKIVLSRIPLGYGIWRNVGLFRHGGMDNANYVANIVEKHMQYYSISREIRGKIVLELGPGDSIASAMIWNAFGARSILVDVDDYAVKDVNFYKKLALQLTQLGIPISRDITKVDNRRELVKVCNSEYLTSGISDLKKIESSTVDFIYSHAVLEHIDLNSFKDFIHETSRIMRKDGIASHQVDLRDHLTGGLNNLRFSEHLWESSLFVKSGFYTNRLRFSQIIKIFEDAGFFVEIKHTNKWQELPIPRNKLSKEFRSYSDNDLLISSFHVILRKISYAN
jgi:SAM-dependent methyltransferase